MMLLRLNTHTLTKANSSELLLIQIKYSHVNSEKNGYHLD